MKTENVSNRNHFKSEQILRDHLLWSEQNKQDTQEKEPKANYN